MITSGIVHRAALEILDTFPLPFCATPSSALQGCFISFVANFLSSSEEDFSRF